MQIAHSAHRSAGKSESYFHPWQRLFQEASRERPLLLVVVDDLQDGSESTLGANTVCQRQFQ